MRLGTVLGQISFGLFARNLVNEKMEYFFKVITDGFVYYDYDKELGRTNVPPECRVNRCLALLNQDGMFDAAPGMGAECSGAMRETAACPDEASEKPKCQFSPWQEWTRCDKTCDDGQTFRTRPFTHPGPAADIWACQQSIIHEAKPCKLKACHDCSTLGKWSPWSACSTNCGQGIYTRDIELPVYPRHPPWRKRWASEPRLTAPYRLDGYAKQA